MAAHPERRRYHPPVGVGPGVDIRLPITDDSISAFILKPVAKLIPADVELDRRAVRLAKGDGGGRGVDALNRRSQERNEADEYGRARGYARVIAGAVG